MMRIHRHRGAYCPKCDGPFDLWAEAQREKRRDRRVWRSVTDSERRWLEGLRWRPEFIRARDAWATERINGYVFDIDPEHWNERLIALVNEELEASP